MISLKDLNEVHLEKMVEWRSSERINKVSCSDVILNIEDQKKWFKSVQKDDTKKYYAIFYKNKYIGICYLTDISFKNSSCSFGIYIGEENYLISGAGFISELKLIHIAFTEFKVNRLHCEVLDSNKNVVHLHKINDALTKILKREKRYQLYEDCLKFINTRVNLDLASFSDDIWSH